MLHGGMHSVRPATSDDRAAIVRTLALAFANDPALSYVFPNPAARPARLQRFFDLIVRSEPDPSLTTLVDNGAAVAVWRAPGAWRTPTLTMLRYAVPLLTTFGTALPRTLRLQALLERHHPTQPHWYLEFVGCDPALQGTGRGGAAIRAGLARADAAGLPCALEAAVESNVSLYRALGFDVTSEFRVADGPWFREMWRPART